MRRGQDLFVIRSSELRNWTSELRTLEQEFDSVGRRLALLEQEQKAGIEIQTTKVQQYDKDLGFQQVYLATLRDLLRRYEQLDTEGLVPRVDVMSQQLAASKGERDVAVTKQSRDMAVLEADRLRTEDPDARGRPGGPAEEDGGAHDDAAEPSRRSERGRRARVGSVRRHGRVASEEEPGRCRVVRAGALPDRTLRLGVDRGDIAVGGGHGPAARGPARSALL